MEYKNIVILSSALLLSAVRAAGQATTATDAPTQGPKLGWQWSAAFDGYASGNLTDTGSGTNSLRSYDVHSNTFRANMLDLGLDYNTVHWGAHVEAGYGDEFRIMMSADRLRSPNSYIPQAYVSYRPMKDSGLQIDFGKFYTSAGVESADAGVNFNYSRSLLFTLGEPVYHFGFRVNMPLTKTFTAGVQLTNGWNGVEDNNDGKTLGFTTALTKIKWSWSQAILVGQEKNGASTGQRQLVNQVLTLTPWPSLQSYIELLYGRDKRAGPGADAWYGVATAHRWTATKKMSFALRLEYYVDQGGFTSGTAQHLREATATAEYKLSSLLATRLEYRADLSNQRVFGHDPNDLSRQQATVLLALLFSMKSQR